MGDGLPQPTGGDANPGPHVFRSLDAWRGVAAVAVMNFHLIGFLSGQSQDIWDTAAMRALSHGHVGVEMFFVISGYCIAAACASNLARGRRVRDFTWARLRRIFPPYWAGLGLALGSALLWRYGNPSAPAPLDFVGPLTPWPASVYLGNFGLLHLAFGQQALLGVSWTLAYEMAFYLVCAVALSLAGRRRGLDETLGLLHLVTAGALLWMIVLPERRAFPFDMWPLFGLGLIVFDLLRRPSGRYSRAGAVVAVSLFAVLAGLHPYLPHRLIDHHTPLVSGAVGVGFAALLLATYRFDQRIAGWPVVQWLGRVGLFSYSLYLTHYTLLVLWNSFAVGRPVFARTVLLQYFVLSAICTGLAYLFFLAFERPLLAPRTKRGSLPKDASRLAKEGPLPAATPATVEGR